MSNIVDMSMPEPKMTLLIDSCMYYQTPVAPFTNMV